MALVFSCDSYFSKLVYRKNHITFILIWLWTSFTFLNLLLPILSISRGKQIFQMLVKVTATPNQRVYIAVNLTVILLNIMYTMSMVFMHTKGYPIIIICLPLRTATCTIPRTATSYNYVLGILITKAVVLPVALLTELVAAIFIITSTQSILLKTTLKRRSSLFIKVIVIWKLLVFVQITVGLISIPLIVLTFISPVRVLLSSIGIILIFALIIWVILHVRVTINEYH